MSERPTESSDGDQYGYLKAAKAAVATLNVPEKVHLVDGIIQEVPGQALVDLSNGSRLKVTSAPLGTTTWKDRREKALAIIESAKMTKDCFYVKIPAGISDIDAIDSMNVLFRERFASLKRDAIDSADLPWIFNLESVARRDINTPRKIPIYFLAPGTRNKSFDEQLELLDNLGLVPADPIDQVLTAMAYGFVHTGVDPFRSQLVRGSVPDWALFNTGSHGLRVFPLNVGRCPIASMSALPAIVK